LTTIRKDGGKEERMKPLLVNTAQRNTGASSEMMGLLLSYSPKILKNN
jgi:hypothetical protein